VLRDLGELAGARTQFKQALEISEAALGSDHPDVATWRGNLAVLQNPVRRVVVGTAFRLSNWFKDSI
jgi:hypothetical protein